MKISNSGLNVSTLNLSNSSIQKTNKASSNEGVDFNSLIAKGAANANNENRIEARVDKIEFKSYCSIEKGTSILSRLSESIKTDIKSETSPQKIEAIQSKIDNGEYKINPNELASLILKI